MAIWTQGTDFVLATRWGIARSSKGTTSVLRFSTVGLRRDEEPPALVSFVVLDGEGTRALVQRSGLGLSVWTHDHKGGTLARCTGDEVLALAASPGGPMVAVAADRSPGGPARLELRAVALDGLRVVLGAPIALPRAPRLGQAWALFPKGGGFAEDARGGDGDGPEVPRFDPTALSVEAKGPAGPWWRGVVRLTANRFGIGVTSTYSGLAAVLDPATLACRLAVRAPTEREQFDAYALPLAEGALVTLVANYRQSEVALLDASGAVVAQKQKVGKELAWAASGPGLAWDERTALVSANDEVHALTLPTLASRRFIKDDGRLVAVGSAVDGMTHLVAVTQGPFERPESWRMARWTRRGTRWSSNEIEVPDFRPSEPAARPVDAAPRVDGTPAIGAVPDATTPWRAAAGTEVVLRVRIENRGGPAHGLYVELGEDALADGLVSGLSVSIDGDGPGAPFVRSGAIARAELADVELEAGFAPLSGRAPRAAGPLVHPSLVIALRVRAERAGQGILSVRVGPRGIPGSTGSGMVGRGFTVTG